MKSRGNKSGKAGSKSKKGSSEVCPSTSLPPLVEGPLQCFLRVTVSKILWAVPKPPKSFAVRLRWWGETSNGTFLYPKDTSQTDQKKVKTTVRYAVCCGSKQLASYLRDMGTLELEVLNKLTHLPIGSAQIDQVSLLSQTHPITGFFTIVSATSENVGELKVSLTLEPPSEDDNRNFTPNIHVNLENALPGHQENMGSSQPTKLSVMPADRSNSGDSKLPTPRGIDHLYFKENSEPNKDLYKGSHNPWNQEEAPVSKISTRITQERDTSGRTKDEPSAAASALLPGLLHQGRKLREGMADSALDPNVEIDTESILPPVLDRTHYPPHTRAPPEILPPPVHQNLLNRHKVTSSKEFILQPPEHHLPDSELYSEERAIELLLGSSRFSLGQYWDGNGSPPESIAGSDLYNESELSDPHYDQSLLENLFYAAPKSDGSTSDDDLFKSRKRKNKHKISGDEEDEGMRKHQDRAEQPSLQKSGMNRSSRKPEEPEAMDLTVDRLALLGRMHVARVIVESLKVKMEGLQVTPNKRNGKGKPPAPPSSMKRTFFVEFHFPVSSKNKAGEVTAASEITRLVSNKVVNGVVRFQQRFVFPVLFSGDTIKHWWKSNLTFTVFLRKGTEKKAGLLGSAVLSLRDVLRSEDLSCTCSLPVHSSENQGERADVGPLKVSISIAGDSMQSPGPTKRTSGAVQETPSASIRHRVSFTEPEDQSVFGSSPEKQTEPAPLVRPVKCNVPSQPEEALSQGNDKTPEENSLLLHVILMVPEGKGFSGASDSTTCNSYLNCKLFSTQEATRSAIVWASNQPAFNFSQVAPVSLTGRLLERMKNNIMIIEVWNKVPSPGTDQLLGLAKLPLHQFYMSFSDQKVCRLLLQAQYPVVAVDSFVPVIDLLSGNERGQLKVLLAMGSGDQVMALQRLKSEVETSPVPPPRPAHFLDPPPPSVQVYRASSSTIDHVFEVHVESVKGLTPLQSTVWGEADCFVQYYFPVHSAPPGSAPEIIETDIALKPVRTATTLCVPDPIFNDRQSHSLVAPSDTPVQRLLLSAFSMQGLAGGGGVTFEIWCRYYYPNVRDQMVAKGTLPLSRLCAMVTMHHREQVGIQAFCLPLAPISETPTETHSPSSGLLNVNVTYRRSVKNPAGMLATRMVSITVQIHRASGLQAAARVLAQEDPSFQYSAEVGVNAFVLIRPPCLPEAESRSTRTVARSFCPEFDHHSEFPCHLVAQRSSGEACSLAETLHFSDILLTIHHQAVATAGANRIQPARDYQLGVVRIPARGLLTKRSGISGWYPVMVPEDSKLPSATGILDNVVGGLELSVAFAHHADRERVLEVARGLGWCEDEEDEAHGRVEQQKDDLVNFSVTIPKIWLPARCLLIPGHKHIHKSTYCYLRYKLYDKEAVCSPLRRPALSEDGQQATVAFEQTKSIELLKDQPLVWYLREEKLEIQIWRTHGKDSSGPRPQETDRLVGCAYVDLAALSENTSRTLSVSGVYPLFKRNAPNLWGAAVRVHLSLGSAYHPSVTARCPSSSAEEHSLSEGDEEQDVSGHSSYGRRDDHDGTSETEQLDHPVKSSVPQSADIDLENTFAVNIIVERAMHLSLKGSPLTERAVSTPSCCVSFAVAGNATPISTPIIGGTDSPTWNFQHQTRLSKELLLDPQQTLVFKVWHKADVERVLGFASVDLSPLLSGFQSVCGWYNIGDFTGQCQGQIKVSVTPLENISHLKEEKRSRSETASTRAEVTARPSFLYHHIPTSCDSFSSYPIVPTVNMADRGEDAHVPVLRGEPSQNMHRLQGSVQQTEWSTEQLDALSHPTRTSLLSALRKNVSELDDIQKYFKQKLYRSLSNPEPMRSTEIKPPRSPNPDQESDAHSLLRKSNLLVSQVGSLIAGLQDNPIFREPPSSSCDVVSHAQTPDAGRMEADAIQEVDHQRLTRHQDLCDDDGVWHRADTPPFSTPASPSRKEEDMEDFLQTSGREENPPIGHDCEDQDLHASSDEEYEENLIEPRTLNEITTMTDRTSPWSSVLSDMENDLAEDNPRPNLGLGALSDVLTGGHDNETLEDIKSDRSQSNGFWNTEEESRLFPGIQNNDVESQEPEFYLCSQPGPLSEDNDEMNRRREDLEGLAVIQTVSAEALNSSDPDESHIPDLVNEGLDDPSGDDIDIQSSSHIDTTGPNTSPSPESSEEQPEEAERTQQQSLQLLSDPILLPNFFLPPQHLEASMRALSASPALPASSAQTAESETRFSKGIPFRRRARPTPRMLPAELPKEEAKRIARIFAAQFSNTK